MYYKYMLAGACRLPKILEDAFRAFLEVLDPTLSRIYPSIADSWRSVSSRARHLGEPQWRSDE